MGPRWTAKVHCVPMNQANLLPANVQCQATADGWSLQSNTYVPVVQLMADIPGHWSDNGMALEPGKVHVVDFNLMSPMPSWTT